MNGTVEAKAKTWALSKAGTGTIQVAVEFEILTPDTELQSISWYGSLTEKAWERTIESLQHMGFEGDDVSNLVGLDANEVQLVLEEEEYQGKWQTKVKWVNRKGGLAVKDPLVGEEARAFAATLRDKIRAKNAAAGVKKPAPTSAAPRSQAPQQSGPPPRRSGPPEPPPMTDADIPF